MLRVNENRSVMSSPKLRVFVMTWKEKISREESSNQLDSAQRHMLAGPQQTTQSITQHPVIEVAADEDVGDSVLDSARFKHFLHKLRDTEHSHQWVSATEPIELQHSGTASFLHYDLGNLQGSDFELLTPAPDKLYREIKDHESKTTMYILPLLCARRELLLESRLVNQRGKPVSVTYKEKKDFTPTTASYPFAPSIFDEGNEPQFYTISKIELVDAFESIREEIRKVIVSRISRATGYKWQYRKSSYKDKVYFLEYNCFQDIQYSPDWGFEDPERLRVFDRTACKSSIHVGIHIFSKKFIVNYHHTPHTKLVDKVFSLLMEACEEPKA